MSSSGSTTAPDAIRRSSLVLGCGSGARTATGFPAVRDLEGLALEDAPQVLAEVLSELANAHRGVAPSHVAQRSTRREREPLGGTLPGGADNGHVQAIRETSPTVPGGTCAPGLRRGRPQAPGKIPAPDLEDRAERLPEPQPQDREHRAPPRGRRGEHPRTAPSHRSATPTVLDPTAVGQPTASERIGTGSNRDGPTRGRAFGAPGDTPAVVVGLPDHPVEPRSRL